MKKSTVLSFVSALSLMLSACASEADVPQAQADTSVQTEAATEKSEGEVLLAETSGESVSGNDFPEAQPYGDFTGTASYKESGNFRLTVYPHDDEGIRCDYILVHVGTNGRSEVLESGSGSNIDIAEDTVLGHEGICLSVDYIKDIHGAKSYYYEDDKKPTPVPVFAGTVFGFGDDLVHYEKDLDGDGNDEFIAQCTYGGDGYVCVNIFKVEDDKTYGIEVSAWDLFKDADLSGMGLGPCVEYDAEKNVFVCFYDPDEPDKNERCEYEINLDKLDLELCEFNK